MPMRPSATMRDRPLKEPRSKEEIVELAEKIGARLMEKRLGGQLSLRLRRLGKRRGREWEMRIFLGKGGYFSRFFDDEVIQVRSHEIRFCLGSACTDFDDLIRPVPVERLEPPARPGPRLRESGLSA